MKWISSKQAAELGKSLAAIVLALVIGALFILVAGESPATAYSSLLKGALGTPQAVANTVSKSIPLAFTGLAVALGSRCGMLNIGAEGQILVGGAATAALMIYAGDSLADTGSDDPDVCGQHGGRCYLGRYSGDFQGLFQYK